jgi:hypothetical protein
MSGWRMPEISAGHLLYRYDAGVVRHYLIVTLPNDGRGSCPPPMTSLKNQSTSTGSSWQHSTPCATVRRSRGNGRRVNPEQYPRLVRLNRITKAPPIVYGPAGSRCSAGGSHAFAARARHHLAPQPLSDGRNAFDALGDWFTLLAFGADVAAVEAFEQAAGSMGMPPKVITEGRARYCSALMLVRPDQFVAWSADHSPPQPGGRIAQGGRR